MRQDQYDKLQALHEELTDVFLQEADPKSWPGANIPAANMDAQTRGDRYWHKKNAVATVAIMMRVANVVDLVQKAGGGGEETPPGEKTGEELLEAEVDSAMKEAKKLMANLTNPAAKANFDARVHGKAQR